MRIFKRPQVFRLGRVRRPYLSGLNGQLRLAEPPSVEQLFIC